MSEADSKRAFYRQGSWMVIATFVSGAVNSAICVEPTAHDTFENDCEGHGVAAKSMSAEGFPPLLAKVKEKASLFCELSTSSVVTMRFLYFRCA